MEGEETPLKDEADSSTNSTPHEHRSFTEFAKDKLDSAGRELRRRLPMAGQLGAHLIHPRRLLLQNAQTQQIDVVLTFPKGLPDSMLLWLLQKLRGSRPRLHVCVRQHGSTQCSAFYITADDDVLLQIAEEIHLPKLLKPEFGGGYKEFTVRDMHCFQLGPSTSLFSSSERSYLVKHALETARAEPGDEHALEPPCTLKPHQSIVPACVSRGVVSAMYPLHDRKALDALRVKWLKSFLAPQPLDEICDYFGVQIAMYFAWLGHYTSCLTVPAVVGFIFWIWLGTANQYWKDVAHVLFSLFNVLWACVYLETWKRYSNVLAYRWGTLDQRDDLLVEPRPEFRGEMTVSQVTGRLEAHYPNWRRLLFRVCVSYPATAVCLALALYATRAILFAQEWWDDRIVYLAWLPRAFLAILIAIEEETYARFARWLNDKGAQRKRWTQEKVLEVITKIKNARVTMSKGETRTGMDYYWSSKYDIMIIANEEHLIFKRTSPNDSTVRIIPKNEYFSILEDTHKSCGHGGRDKMLYAIKTRYYIPKKAVEIFVSLCPTCETKKVLPKKGIVTKPIVTQDFNIRGQVDLMDFQSCADGEYKWLLNYQDNATKYVSLRPLKTKRAQEVAIELLKIFMTFGAPYILQSDNGREFTANIIEELTSMWPECKIIHGSPRRPQTQGSVERSNQDVENMLRSWMNDNRSVNWSVGCYHVQYKKNSSFHRIIGRSPYKALFGCDPKTGLSSSAIPISILTNLETEEQLQNLLEQDTLNETIHDSTLSQIQPDNNLNRNVPVTDQVETETNSDLALEPCCSKSLQDATETSKNINVDQNYMENEESENIEPNLTCVVCHNACTGAHTCNLCENTVHVICAFTDDEHEGYGSKVLCFLCKNEQHIHSERNEAHRGTKRAAEKMVNNTAKKLPPLTIGDTVIITVPKVDRGPLDTQFQFINSFSSLFYIAFYLHDMDKLKEQLAVLLITRQIIGNLKESALPYVIENFRLAKMCVDVFGALSPSKTPTSQELTEMFNKKTDSTNPDFNDVTSDVNGDGDRKMSEPSVTRNVIHQAEMESQLFKYDGTFSEYLEMLTQLGHVTLFSCAFPLSAACALLNNALEIRADALKLCAVARRPFGSRVTGIGGWQNAMEAMLLVAVIVNCCLIGLSGPLHRLMPDMESTHAVILIVALEHLILIMVLIVRLAIPEIPSWLATEMAKVEFERREAIKNMHTVLSENPSQDDLTKSRGPSRTLTPTTPKQTKADIKQELLAEPTKLDQKKACNSNMFKISDIPPFRPKATSITEPPVTKATGSLQVLPDVSPTKPGRHKESIPGAPLSLLGVRGLRDEPLHRSAHCIPHTSQHKAIANPQLQDLVGSVSAGTSEPDLNASRASVDAGSTAGDIDKTKEKDKAGSRSRAKALLVKRVRSVAVFSLGLRKAREAAAEKPPKTPDKPTTPHPPQSYGGELSLIPIEQLIQMDDVKRPGQS